VDEGNFGPYRLKMLRRNIFRLDTPGRRLTFRAVNDNNSLRTTFSLTTRKSIMSENTTSHAQQNMDAWKKIVDQQLELVGSVSTETARIRKLTFDKAVENIDELHRVSKKSFEHVQELADPREQVVAWSELMNRQLEIATGLTKSLSDVHNDGAEKTRATFKTLSNLSDTTLEHAVKLNKAWHDAAMDTAKRVAGWMPSSH